MQFYESIKSERVRLGLTQAEAASLCQVSPRIWWQWEHGKDPIHPTKIGVLQILRGENTKSVKTQIDDKAMRAASPAGASQPEPK